MRNSLVILALSVCGLVLGIWRGEDLTDPFPQAIDLLWVPIWTGSFLLVSWRKPGVRRTLISCAAIIPASVGVGYVAGDQSGSRAFNECVREGESVRVALQEFRVENGRYPEKLESLQLESLPGGRLLRGGVLEYERTAEGYSLSYGDYLVTFEGTESSPILGVK